MADREQDRLDGVFARVDPGKRAFLKKVVVTTAFVVPTVASFSLDGMSAHAAVTPSNVT
jgi:hypothetical protein